jgi:regulatory protein
MDTELTVSEVRYQGDDGRVLKVRFSDDSILFLDADHTTASLALDLRNSGAVLDGESYDLLLQADELFRCRRKAISLLSRAEQCRKGLEAKLIRKGWSRETVAASLDRLESAGLLDDRRFAETWVRGRLRSRPEGSSKLIGGLMAKGVNGGIAREAVQSVLEELGDAAADDILRQALEKLSRRSDMDDEKLIRSLVRRGFGVSQVRKVIALRKDEE